MMTQIMKTFYKGTGDTRVTIHVGVESDDHETAQKEFNAERKRLLENGFKEKDILS